MAFGDVGPFWIHLKALAAGTGFSAHRISVRWHSTFSRAASLRLSKLRAVTSQANSSCSRPDTLSAALRRRSVNQCRVSVDRDAHHMDCILTQGQRGQTPIWRCRPGLIS